MATVTKVAHLRQLLSLLSDSIDAIEAHADAQNATYPTLNDLLTPDSPEEKLAATPETRQAALVGAAAAAQLVAALETPTSILYHRLSAFHISSSLRLAAEASVAEILRGSPDGLHVDVIAEKSGVDAGILGRVLRLLATQYVFREVEPNVFANNRISVLLDTGKAPEALRALSTKKWKNATGATPVNHVQGEKYINSEGYAALVEVMTDEAFKSSAFFSEYVFSDDKAKVPFQRAYNFDGNYFNFLEANPGYFARTQNMFASTTRLEPQDTILKGFDFSSLPEGAVVMDVGGGHGLISEKIATHDPRLKVVLVDREKTISGIVRPSWEANPQRKQLLDAGRVSFQPHDFFTAWPTDVTKDASLFLLRFIIHDWDKPTSTLILKNIHAAAPPHARLLIVDRIVPYACATPQAGEGVAGAADFFAAPPPPLLTNPRAGNGWAYYADMLMLNMFNGQERTLGEFIELFEATGWKLVRLYTPPNAMTSQLECVRI